MMVGEDSRRLAGSSRAGSTHCSGQSRDTCSAAAIIESA